jgi:hypothetical protein
VPLDLLLLVRLELTLRGCRARASGSVRRGDVVCAPARGTFWIATNGRRCLRVRIWCRDPDGARHCIDGAVRVDRSSLAWSLTRLRGVLWCGTRPIGRVELRFDLRRGLYGWLRSLRLSTKAQ